MPAAWRSSVGREVKVVCGRAGLREFRNVRVLSVTCLCVCVCVCVCVYCVKCCVAGAAATVAMAGAGGGGFHQHRPSVALGRRVLHLPLKINY